MSWDLSGLEHFKTMVTAYKKSGLETASKFAIKGVADEISNIVQDYYPDAITTYDSKHMKSNRNGSSARLIITAEDLWFREFGTGLVGSESVYLGNYPNRTLNFYSRGSAQQTNGWVYSYHPQTKMLGGWWYIDPETGKPTFTQGQVSQMGVARTVRDIRLDGVPDLGDYINKHMRG